MEGSNITRLADEIFRSKFLNILTLLNLNSNVQIFICRFCFGHKKIKFINNVTSIQMEKEAN